MDMRSVMCNKTSNKLLYLACTNAEAPRGHRGNAADLRIYTTSEHQAVLWVAVRNGDHVLMRHVSNGLLQANGRYRRWLNGVSVDDDASNQSTMNIGRSRPSGAASPRPRADDAGRRGPWPAS
ncbi:hypothetical protein HU200_015494 [Digitaria exilis]|uniref:Uncharacterized protein n=1 Tax=Digitaria exilis TaxID=1010633 RepID=A0A835KKZ8_9POAL|nr:hypothetical protein HU200_015494 [Digitaria exilis]